MTKRIHIRYDYIPLIAALYVIGLIIIAFILICISSSNSPQQGLSSTEEGTEIISTGVCLKDHQSIVDSDEDTVATNASLENKIETV